MTSQACCSPALSEISTPKPDGINSLVRPQLVLCRICKGEVDDLFHVYRRSQKILFDEKRLQLVEELEADVLIGINPGREAFPDDLCADIRVARNDLDRLVFVFSLNNCVVVNTSALHVGLHERV